MPDDVMIATPPIPAQVRGRVGILGGTFDPIHQAHLFIAEEARVRCRLDRVIFIPNAVSPFKATAQVSAAEDRYEMARLAVAGNPAFEVSRIEIDRPGPSYTVDTLRGLRDDMPGTELFLIVGADAVADISWWREPEEVLRLARVIALARPHQSFDVIRDRLLPAARDRVDWIETLQLDISATEIRERVRAGRSIRYLTPDPVARYIEERGLYR